MKIRVESGKERKIRVSHFLIKNNYKSLRNKNPKAKVSLKIWIIPTAWKMTGPLFLLNVRFQEKKLKDRKKVKHMHLYFIIKEFLTLKENIIKDIKHDFQSL